MWQIAPPPQARSQDFILGSGSEHVKRANHLQLLTELLTDLGGLMQGGGSFPPPPRSAEALTFH